MHTLKGVVTLTPCYSCTASGFYSDAILFLVGIPSGEEQKPLGVARLLN